MHLGIWAPVVHYPPHQQHPDWVTNGTIEDIDMVVRAAEQMGYEFVCAPEHVAMPDTLKAVRGERYWDPLAVLGYLAATTRRISLVTFVLVMPYHHPLAIAKRYGTLDRISGGRVKLGIGVGSLEEEFALLGADFKQRGSITDDGILALKAAMGNRMPSYAGKHFNFSGMIIDPPLRAGVDIWIGGKAKVSLKRAARLGAVWAPVQMKVREIVAALDDPEVKDLLAQRATPLEILYIGDSVELDPIGDPGKARGVIASMKEANIRYFMPRVAHRTREHYIEQLQAVKELVQTAG